MAVITPAKIGWRGSRPAVEGDGRGREAAENFSVPVATSGKHQGGKRILAFVVGRVGVHEVDQRLPGGSCLLLGQPLKHHRDLKTVVRPCADLLAPFGIKKAGRIKTDEVGKKPAVGLVRS